MRQLYLVKICTFLTQFSGNSDNITSVTFTISCSDVPGILGMGGSPKDAEVYETTLPSGTLTVQNLQCISILPPNNYNFFKFCKMACKHKFS